MKKPDTRTPAEKDYDIRMTLVWMGLGFLFLVWLYAEWCRS